VVSGAGRLRALSARPQTALQTTTDEDDRQQTPTDASEQNNTGPLGGLVIQYVIINRDDYHCQLGGIVWLVSML